MLILLFLSILLDSPSLRASVIDGKDNHDADSLKHSLMMMVDRELASSRPASIVTITTKCHGAQESGMVNMKNLPFATANIIKYDQSLDNPDEKMMTQACMPPDLNYEEANTIYSVITSVQKAMNLTVIKDNTITSIVSIPTTISTLEISTMTVTLLETTSIEPPPCSSITLTRTELSPPSTVNSIQTITVTEKNEQAPISQMTITVTESSMPLSMESTESLLSESLLSLNDERFPVQDDLSTQMITSTSDEFSLSSLSSMSIASIPTLSSIFSTSFPSTTMENEFRFPDAISTTSSNVSYPMTSSIVSSFTSSTISTSSHVSTTIPTLTPFKNVDIPINFSFPFNQLFSVQMEMLQNQTINIVQMASLLQSSNILTFMWSSSLQIQMLLSKILMSNNGIFKFDITMILKLLFQTATTVVTEIMQKVQSPVKIVQGKLSIDCFNAIMSIISNATAIDTCHKNYWYNLMINRHQYPINVVITSMLRGKLTGNGKDANDKNPDISKIQLRMAVRNYFESIYQSRYYQNYYQKHVDKLKSWYESNLGNTNSTLENGMLNNGSSKSLSMFIPNPPPPARLCPSSLGLTRKSSPWLEHLPAYVRMAYYTDQSDKPLVYFREETCALCKMKKMGILEKGEYCYLCKIERVKQRLLEIPGGILQTTLETLLRMRPPSPPISSSITINHLPLVNALPQSPIPIVNSHFPSVNNGQWNEGSRANK